MATMIREKRREKKKHRNKTLSEIEINDEERLESKLSSNSSNKSIDNEATTSASQGPSSARNIDGDTFEHDNVSHNLEQHASPSTEGPQETACSVNQEKSIEEQDDAANDVTNKMNNVILDAKRNLEEIYSFAVSDPVQDVTKNAQESAESNEAHDITSGATCLEQDVPLSSTSKSLYPQEAILPEDTVAPSAPLAPIQIESQPYVRPCEYVLKRDKVTCMPLEEAVRLIGEKEIAEVRELSKKEEAYVEFGPQSGPEHPLVDLLSTFRTSLISIERERNRISCAYASEEQARASLWSVHKRSEDVTQRCGCGADVRFRAAYETATLHAERLPAAKLRLDALLSDVQDCYCHHQHAALQAHYEVDELVGEIIKGPKGGVREALLLVLQALQLSDAAPDAYAAALQRWAGILAAALLDQRDLRQLLFLLHCLFKQTRSVQWAARVVSLQCADPAAAARLLAVLELLLARPRLDQAHECTEESETWEEVDVCGEGGGVAEGRLRERDVLALLDALPLRDVLARLLLFQRADIEQEDEQSWGERAGGRDVLRACCGVRALLGVLRRAMHAHAHYARLRASLRRLAASALHALAALHLHSKHLYEQQLEERIAAELEACFVTGLDALGEEQPPPAALLSAAAAADYCAALMTGLHDESPLRVESLSACTPRVSCALRVQAVAQAALDRELDQELATTVLDFLLQVGIKSRPACQGACDASARELLPSLLALHRLHGAALHLLADLHQVSPVSVALLVPLAPQQWRPTPGEMRALLDDWVLRCAALLPHLLEQLDYTPHTGISLESQLVVGAWLCDTQRGETPEWAWRVLRALRVHRSQWGLPLEAPPPDRTDQLLATAYALLASDWGHCLPLVCGPGVEALWRLAGARAADALHCAAPLMRVMAQSPESVSLTPKFAEVFTAILNSGPSLVARALGRRASCGQEQLQRVLLEQLQDNTMAAQERSALLSAWLHALWRPGVPAGGRAALDVAVRAAREWRTLDAHARTLLQEENAKDYIVDAVRNVGAAPLLCEAVLRHAHAAELRTHTHARLADELARQKAAHQKIHVDNALKQIGSRLTHDELAMSRCAGAALAADPQHPAHLLLWRLLLHMYLQRPPAAPPDSQTPVGPMFFSGLLKARTLSQLKKRLQETAIYHRTQAELLKTKEGQTVSPSISKTCMEKTSNPTSDNSLFSPLAMIDLAGESDAESDGNLSDEDGDRGARETSVDCDANHLACYHTAAEKIVREYLLWLEEGEAVRAAPHCADVARFLSEQALDKAWRWSLSSGCDRPATPPPPARVAAQGAHAYSTHCERALAALALLKRPKRRRYKIPDLPTLGEAYSRDASLALGLIQPHLADMEQFTREWTSELERVRKLDAQLWELVARHRVRRPLPPVRRACPQGCSPITIHMAKDEWCISTGAEQGIQENRRSASAALRRLARARPHVARSASRLRALSSRLRSQAAALRACELAVGAVPRLEPYAPARNAAYALLDDLTARFICVDAALAAAHLSRWGAASGAERLCALLVRPAQLRALDWPALYTAVLKLALPPHVAFSYLSKFELSAWADTVDTGARGAVLGALLAAAGRLGAQPGDQNLVLLELLGVHCSSVVRAAELCPHVLRCTSAAFAPAALPPPFLAHLPVAVNKYGEGVNFDELGHCLRQLGAIFWTARRDCDAARRTLYGAYAPHFADTLHALLRAFVGAAVARTYEPVRVSVYAWSALSETWPAWLLPHGTHGALLAGTAHEPAFAHMLARFAAAIHMVMRECPGSEDTLLRQVFEWALRSHECVQHRCAQEARAQLAALLAQLAELPWTRQWFSVHLLHLCVQVSRSTVEELAAWCSARLQHQRANTWLHDATDECLPQTLALLLELFTCKELAFPHTTLAEAARLPWERLEEAALHEALARYLAAHHSPALPYHAAPHFDLMLTACQLVAAEDARALRLPGADEKRANAVSQWVRAAAAPALAPHVPAHTARLLRTLTDLAPYIEESELEHLLSRACVALCIQPACESAAPVWLQWVEACPPRVLRAVAGAAATLTAQQQFAALGDAVARAILAHEEGGGWRAVSGRWAQSPWRECGALLARGAPHAAYATLLAHAHTPEHMRQAFAALAAAELNFARDELIAAVWVCVAARAADGADGAARALLTRWAEQRRSLLQVVTLLAPASCPTPQLRVLLRLALCVVSPSEGARQAYEQACEALPAAAHARAWARAERPPAVLLPRLAACLYPGREVYFKEELELAADPS